MQSCSENTQTEIGEVTEFLTQLQRTSESAVCFTHHTGHLETGRMRGTSDLEAWWSSKVAVQRVNNLYTVTSEHREAPDIDPFQFSLIWDSDTESIRLRGMDNTAPQLRTIILEFLGAHTEHLTVTAIADGVHRGVRVM